MTDKFDDVTPAVHRHQDMNPLDTANARTGVVASRLISRLYGAASQPLRAKLIACLVRPLGPLGLVAVAAGAFAGLLRRSSSGGVTVVIDDVARYSNEQVYELARFVEQVSPEALAASRRRWFQTIRSESQRSARRQSSCSCALFGERRNEHGHAPAPRLRRAAARRAAGTTHHATSAPCNAACATFSASRKAGPAPLPTTR